MTKPATVETVERELEMALAILHRAEDFLRSESSLTAARRNAISLARFEMARLTWPEDAGEAGRIVDTLLRSQPNFQPQGHQPGGHHPPASYRLLWRLLGFRAAESVADTARIVRRTLHLGGGTAGNRFPGQANHDDT